MNMKVIAHIKSDFPAKFGIPHQSGRIEELKAEIIFEPEYRNPDAVRGLEEYTHIWLIWEFLSGSAPELVPNSAASPDLGEMCERRFATRSPFAPILWTFQCEAGEGGFYRYGPCASCIRGADLMDGTPYDIKPYLAYADSHPQAAGGFTDRIADHKLKVEFPENLLGKIPEEKKGSACCSCRRSKTSYQKSAEREYGMSFGIWDVHFKVQGKS